MNLWLQKANHEFVLEAEKTEKTINQGK